MEYDDIEVTLKGKANFSFTDFIDFLLEDADYSLKKLKEKCKDREYVEERFIQYMEYQIDFYEIFNMLYFDKKNYETIDFVDKVLINRINNYKEEREEN